MNQSSSVGRVSKTKPNYFYTVISVALVLFLLGIFGMLALHAQNLVEYLKENVEILVELRDEIEKPDRLLFQKKLEGSSFVKPGSVNFISKEEAATKMQEDFGKDLLTDGMNPLFDALTFNLNSAYMNGDSLKAITTDLEENELVANVYYQEELVETISSNLTKFAIVVLAISLLAILITITLINNTIKLALYSNRFLIKNMQLVGATWGFIRRPYLVRSINLGILSAFIAIIALVLLLYFVQMEIPELRVVENWQRFAILFGGILLLGIFISLLSTWRGVSKYLRVRLDDLY